MKSESLKNLTKEEIIQMLLKEKEKNSILSEKIVEIKTHHAVISKKLEEEEDFITNKLMIRLEEIQKEKTILMAKLKDEEENIQNNLRIKQKQIHQEKVNLENKLEQEEEQILNKINKQLKETVQKKDILIKKLNEEKIIRDKLIVQINNEIDQKKSLSNAITKLYQDKIELENEKDKKDRKSVV